MRFDLFPTLDRVGAELADAVEHTIRSVFPNADVRRQLSTTPFAVERSVLAADVVVLDLTPAPDGVHRYTAMAYPWQRDHVLAVSRDYLPINVAPVRAGGAGIYPRSTTPERITAWVREQLTGPRPIRPTSRANRLLHRFGRAADPPLTADIFLSYRGINLTEAEALRAKLEAGAFHDGSPRTVTLIPPGELASSGEVLPAVLRWNVLAIISDRVLACREMWVLDTPEYLASWWTQGELVCRPYFRKPESVHTFDPRTGRVSSDEDRFGGSLTLTDAQRKRIARMFTNSHPDLMAPESSEAMRRLASTGWRYAGDEAFTGDFSTVPLLQCPACSFGAGPPRRVDVPAFLSNDNPRLYPVAPATLAAAVASGDPLSCPNPACAERFTIRTAPPRYLWFALPVGAGCGSFLEAVPTWFAFPTGPGADYSAAMRASSMSMRSRRMRWSV